MKKTVIIGVLFSVFLGVLNAGQSKNKFNSWDNAGKPSDYNFENSFEPEYSAVLVLDNEEKIIENQTITSEKADELCVLAKNGAKVTFKNCKFIKTGSPDKKTASGNMPPKHPENSAFELSSEKTDKKGRPVPPEIKNMKDKEMALPPEMNGDMNQLGPGSSEDNYNFYGMNSAVVACGEGTQIILENCTIETAADFANAVFSTKKAEITVKNIQINTLKDSSRGLFSTMDGNIYAEGKILIDTKGAHCAPIATDRGGGTVIVKSINTEESYVHSSGDGSPCIYSTGKIVVENLKGDAEISQAVVIEGKNSVYLKDSVLTGNDKNYGGIMLYQSTSGDAEDGTCVLTMENTVVQDKGGISMFLVTNTTAQVDLDNCRLLNKDGTELSSEDTVVLCKNCNTEERLWGKAGSNGGQAYITVNNQKLTGSLCAKEKDSFIQIKASDKKNVSLKKLKGNGKTSIK